jgi:dipeptidyl aminopeptidase/acylaminoacyl peptidase
MPHRNGHVIERCPFTHPESCYEADGRVLKPEFDYLARVEASEISYWSEGLRIHGFLVKPMEGGTYPCIIYNRGGNRDFAAIDARVVVQLLCRMASWGYVVVASQYRGHGPNEGQDEFGGRDLEDVMNLFPLLEREPSADASRIGMYGGSRGGMMTYLALARTDRVRAAVIRCGVSDLTDWREDRHDMEEVFQALIPGFDAADDRPLVARSAVRWAERLCKRTPLLILQGTADWRVSPVSALRFAERLLAVRHPFRLVMLEGSDHALTEHLAERNRFTQEWFDGYVRDGNPLPDMQPHGD